VKRLITIAISAAVLAAVVVGAVFASSYREYGLEPTPRPKADCPKDESDPCRVLGQVTAIQVQNLRGQKLIKYPTRARRRNGWLVAFSLSLSKPTKGEIEFFNMNFGKPAKARVSILTPDPQKGDRKNRDKTYRLHNQSEVFTLNPYFGKKAWFVLKKRMHVRKRQVIALTVPTWAPALSTELDSAEKWRGSRNPKDCDNPLQSAAHQRVEVLRSYRCLYTTARVLYTALVVNKTPPIKE
jgi:hypothetical protein